MANGNYLANSEKNYAQLYTIAKDLGLNVTSKSSATDVVKALKVAAGSSNTYGNTIGNETFTKLNLNYKVTKDGTITEKKKATSEPIAPVTDTTATETPAEETQAETEQTTTDTNTNTTASGSLPTNYYDLMGALQQQLNSGSGSLEQAKATNASSINSQYDDAARNYYKLYKSQLAQSPEYLSRVGATGGASETYNLGLLNNYSGNLLSNENSRNTALSDSNVTYDTQIAQNTKDAADTLSNYYYQLSTQAIADKKEADEAAAEEAKTTAISTWNTDISSQASNALKNGKTVYMWTDSNGKYQYSTDIDTALSSGYEFSRLNSKETLDSYSNDTDVETHNTSISNAVSDLLKKGKTVYIWTDSKGKYHYNMNIGYAATASGGDYTRLNTQELLSQYTSTTSSNSSSTNTTDTTKTDDTVKKDDTTKKKTDDGSYTIKTNKGITLTFDKNGELTKTSGSLSNGDYFTGSDGKTWYYNNGQWSTKGQADKTGADANSTVFNGYKNKITKLFTEPSNGIVNSNTKTIAYSAIDNFDVSEAQKQELYAWADVLYSKTKS